MRRSSLILGGLLLTVAAFACKSEEPAAPVETKKITVGGGAVADVPAPPDVAAAPDSAEKTESGLACVVLKKGTGTVHPTYFDTVAMHQLVWTTDGKMRMNTAGSGGPVDVELSRNVFPGLLEAIGLMVEGEKRRCWVPQNLTFGDSAPEGQEDLGTLVYELDLVTVTKAKGIPEAPADVAAIPANAKRTESGLASRVLKKGSEKKSPTANSTVMVHYTAWTSEGKAFMTTANRGTPKNMPVRSTTPGWTEGLQMMKVGEKRRFWIPEELALQARPRGWPSGLVVLDVELISTAP